MSGAQGAKKYVILFIILFVPTIAYLCFTAYQHSKLDGQFAHIPNVTYTDEDGNIQNRHVPNFSLVNQKGDTITNKDLEGRIYVVDFFFTKCPSICPIMTANLMNIAERFAQYEEFMVVSLTVDPKRDNPTVLKEYAEARKIDSDKWYFLTGERDSIYATAYHYLASVQEDSLAAGGFLHTENFVLVDKEGNLRSRRDEHGNIMAVYDGTNARHMKDLTKDINTLIAEYKLELRRNNKRADDE